MSDTYGKYITLTIVGESHGPAVGAVLSGLAAGIPVDAEFMRHQMELRRAKGQISTARSEEDAVRILSGVYNGYTTGTAITLMIENKDAKSGDYEASKNLLRPGHADYTASVKYRGYADLRGGGHASGRLTAPFVAACSILTKLLQERGIFIATHLAECAGIGDMPFSEDPAVLQRQMHSLNEKPFPVLNDGCGKMMQDAIRLAADSGDSVGGILETAVIGLPAGLGEPFFGSVESELASLLFSIPAVKGVEFGAGFGFARMKGSRANDPLRMKDGQIVTSSNHNGGINGGITNGMPLIVRTAVKPTPSIYMVQQTVDYEKRRNAVLQISGRHDPCIAHRARVVQDSAAALCIAELLCARCGTKWQEDAAWNTD